MMHVQVEVVSKKYTVLSYYIFRKHIILHKTDRMKEPHGPFPHCPSEAFMLSVLVSEQGNVSDVLQEFQKFKQRCTQPSCSFRRWTEQKAKMQQTKLQTKAHAERLYFTFQKDLMSLVMSSYRYFLASVTWFVLDFVSFSLWMTTCMNRNVELSSPG